MMFEAIYASKLYRASTRKDKIEAAFNDPINSELVGQLATALDEEYKTPEYLVRKQDRLEEEPAKDTSSVPANDTSSGEPSIPHVPAGGGGHGSTTAEPSGEPNESSDGGEQDSAESAPTNNEEPAADPTAVEESTLTSGSPVVGSLMRNPFKNMRQVADQIKGMLNFKDSTHGVNRILCKENEMWIYYNDDVNLNSVMAEVIETLNAASYVYLEFNRLARSDNAIVFLIDFADSNNIMQVDPAEQKK